MFRFTQKPSSGSYSQCLAKITHVINRIFYADTVNHMCNFSQALTVAP